MKIPKTLLILLAATAALGAMAPRQARADVTVSFFYDSLDPYGEWVQTPDYGYCWHPTNVDENWAPYTDGYWAYTDEGWTWVSYEDYGGVVYHYGRWARLPGEGWVWVPGNTWAPAWVSWRSNDDYIGWAPLPPEARWSSGVGFSTWVDARFDIGPGYYSFVGVRDFGAPVLGAVILHRDRNVEIIGNTTNITNITVNNSNVYVGGPRFDRVEARSARHIPTLKLVRQGDASLVRQNGGKILSRQQGNNLVVLAPRITPTAAGAHLAPTKVAKTLTDVKSDHGWSGVSDPDQRAKLTAHFKEQAGTGNTAAKPVNPEDVKLVDTQIKTHGTKGAKGANGANVTNGAGTAPGLGNELALPSATPKGKGGKNKNADLLNTPATEEPGTATAGETPASSKKGKKGHTAAQDSFLNSTGGATGESTPKAPKAKKARTPSDFETGGNGADAVSTPKHSKTKESDTGLQPFDAGGNGGGGGNVGGGGNGGGNFNADRTPKPKRTPKEDVGSSRDSNVQPKSFDSRPAGNVTEQPQAPKQPKEHKGKEKKDDKKGDQTPGQ